MTTSVEQSGPEPQGVGWFGPRGAILKKDHYTATIVDVAYYGDLATGTASQQILSFRRIPRRPDGGLEFNEPVWSLVLRNEEVANLLTLLGDATATVRTEDSAPLQSGTAAADSPLAALIDLMDGEGIDTGNLVDVLAQRTDLGAVVAGLAATDEGLSAAEGALISQRRDLVARLRRMTEDPDTTETDLQRVIGNTYWLFGGRYVGVAERRNIAPLDQHDIPLLGADGTLHIVELKGPNVPNLVRKHRNHWIVGSDVHEATSQAINYLRTLDETGSALSTVYRNEFGIDYDMRRLFATVVIGHPAHITHADKRIVEQTIRSYNSHLSRVEVITYATLLDTAERALEFEDTARAQPPAGPPG